MVAFESSTFKLALYIQNRIIKRRVEEKLFDAEIKLEERRNALLAKLMKEEAEYARELEIHYR